jgi:hypothetical protein
LRKARASASKFGVETGAEKRLLRWRWLYSSERRDVEGEIRCIF